MKERKEKREKRKGTSPFLPFSPSPFLHLVFLRLALFTTCLSFSLFPAFSQSLTIETGLGYVEQGNSQYLDYFKVGAKAMFPVSENVDLYVAPYWLGGFNVDAGAWFRLPITIQDLEGFRSYVGTGLSLTQARFGLALSAAVSYDLSDQAALMLTYTHRPLITSGFSQVFDVAVGISFDLR